MNQHTIADEIMRGKVSFEGFAALKEAEIYGTAAPMQWLGKQLNALAQLLYAGNAIEVHTEDEKYSIRDVNTFFLWVVRNFPDAYVCFFEASNKLEKR